MASRIDIDLGRKAIELLDEHQWSSNYKGYMVCPDCLADPSDGHYSWCDIGQVLDMANKRRNPKTECGQG